jgi:protocatechuate 3,4-dioxygenase beta subunit
MVIAGVVRDGHGEPVPGVPVYVVDAPAALPDVAAVTDAEGRFALTAPVAGRYAIEAAGGQARASVDVDQGDVEIELGFSGS